MTNTDRIIEKYLALQGDTTYLEFAAFHSEVNHEKRQQQAGSRNFVCLDYIERKLMRGMSLCLQYSSSIYVVMEDTIEDIERGYDEVKHARELSPKRTRKKAPKKAAKKRKGKDLGKVVDHGDVPRRGKSDIYWGREGIKQIFKPTDENIRVGDDLPDSYKYYDMRFLEKYYGLRAFEFGNWLSQQDRVNYLSGLGLALFDLYHVLRWAPEKISIKGKLAVAFGARGRGKALAHFEPGAFVINLTRYSRPQELTKRPANFKRVALIVQDGGVGAFAHEYGHALDYFGGSHVERGHTLSLSGDDETNVEPDTALMKKNSLRGLMEKLLMKIVWKSSKAYTPYYERMNKAAPGKYHIQRNEIFARAFESYIRYKLSKQKYKNVFLNFPKYSDTFYLTMPELKRVEPEFDALMNGLKKHL